MNGGGPVKKIQKELIKPKNLLFPLLKSSIKWGFDVLFKNCYARLCYKCSSQVLSMILNGEMKKSVMNQQKKVVTNAFLFPSFSRLWRYRFASYSWNRLVSLPFVVSFFIIIYCMLGDVINYWFDRHISLVVRLSTLLSLFIIALFCFMSYLRF